MNGLELVDVSLRKLSSRIAATKPSTSLSSWEREATPQARSAGVFGLPISVLSLAGVIGLAFASHTGHAGSSSAATIPNKITAGSSAARWVWQNPRPQGNTLFGASFVDSNTGTATGDNGKIGRASCRESV